MRIPKRVPADAGLMAQGVVVGLFFAAILACRLARTLADEVLSWL